jgi:hypothetical protein
MSDRDGIDVLIAWASNKGYTIEISKEGDNSVDGKSKHISVSSLKSKEEQLAIIMHECGHIQMFINGGILKMDEQSSKWSEDSRKYKTCVLIEEVEAWRRGIALAKKLDIVFDDNFVKLTMINAILKYAKWC